MNCYLIQFYKSFTLLNALFYENRIKVFHI